MKTKEELKQYHKKWREAHKDRWNSYGKKWYAENKEARQKTIKVWADAHKENVRDRSRRWSIENKEYRANEQRARLLKYKRAVVAAYGGKCACCGETDVVFLTVEHLRKNGKEHRKVGGNFYLYLVKNNFPKKDDLCILCMNCNWAERNGSLCPHKTSALTSEGVTNL